MQDAVRCLAIIVCLLLHSRARAEFESARIFPASAKVWVQVSNVRATRDLMAGGFMDSLYQRISKSDQWRTVLRNLKLDDHSAYNQTGLRMVELMEMLEGEVAFGLSNEDGASRWCFYLDPKTEYVALEILRSSLEKKFEERGYSRKENRVGDCYLYAWIKGDDCLIAYVIRDEKLLASNSPSMLVEMTKRWIESDVDGLQDDPEFAASFRSTSALSQPGINLFIRNQQLKLIRSSNGVNEFSSSAGSQGYRFFLNTLAALDMYGILPFFQSEVTSTFACLQFPDRSNRLELALKIQVNTPAGDKLFKQPGRATFPDDAPFAALNVISYSVLDADFWTASDYLRRLTMDSRMLKALDENKQLARKHGVPEAIFANKDSKHLKPIAFRCVLDDGSNAVVFRFRNREASVETYSKSRSAPAFGSFISSTRREIPEGFYHTEVIKNPIEFPASLGLAKSKNASRIEHYGIRGDYFIICNSERFFQELPLNPEEPLNDSVSYQMVRRKLDEQFSGKPFALDYWDLPRLLESGGNAFENSTAGAVLRILGASAFNELFQSLAEDLGPVGGAVSKNKNGFRLDYIMLTRR